jgi:hypothetical protein
MKKIIITVTFLISISLISNAQKQETIAKFRITEATNNGNDISQWYFERKQFLVFFNDKDKQLCLANVSGINDEQSYGRVYSLQREKIKETETSYEADVFSFRWKYSNSYNSETGYATVSLTKIYKPAGVIFSIKMVLPNLDVLRIKGYMEGTLNLNDYVNN